MTETLEAFFLSTPDGQRFCLHSRPNGTVRAAVLYVHPFAEELNKTRRMAALQARSLAEAGYAVLQIDLRGCGDSSGDFGDATWQSWVDDVVLAGQWLRGKYRLPLWLWGLRAGCLLGAAAAPRLGPDCNFLFWQPAASGKLLLQQFLRLKLASGLLGGNSKASSEALRIALQRGETVEIAGYHLSAQLALGLEQATLSPPKAAFGRLECLEVSARPDATPTPATSHLLGLWRQAGYAARARLVEGPAFWQTAEIEQANALLPATLETLDLTPAP